MESITTLVEHGNFRNLQSLTKIKWYYDTCLSYIHMYVHMKCIFHITNISIEFNNLYCTNHSPIVSMPCIYVRTLNKYYSMLYYTATYYSNIIHYTLILRTLVFLTVTIYIHQLTSVGSLNAMIAIV